VVYCEPTRVGREVLVPDDAAIGEHGLRAGRLVFFGDPRLLADLAPLVGAAPSGR
jgi:hypothetical protein